MADCKLTECLKAVKFLAEQQKDTSERLSAIEVYFETLPERDADMTTCLTILADAFGNHRELMAEQTSKIATAIGRQSEAIHKLIEKLNHLDDGEDWKRGY